MKHNLKMRERLGALLLALLFIVQAVLGLLPACVTQAASLSIETWDNDKMVDYSYRFDMKFQPGITTYESFGCDNLERLFRTMGKANVIRNVSECIRIIRLEVRECVITM